MNLNISLAHYEINFFQTSCLEYKNFNKKFERPFVLLGIYKKEYNRSHRKYNSSQVKKKNNLVKSDENYFINLILMSLLSCLHLSIHPDIS